MNYVEAPNFTILVNGAPTEYFHSTIGLRQGYPLSPYLFILCFDTLSHVLRAVVQGLALEPYWPTPRAQPLSHPFADDCFFIDRVSFQNARCFTTIIEYCVYLASL